jgi:hypothetical protein
VEPRTDRTEHLRVLIANERKDTLPPLSSTATGWE